MYHHRLKGISSGLLALLAAVASHAALEWPMMALTIKADPKLPTAEAVYPFKNSGSEQVVIKRVTTSCDCTKATLAKEYYGPGEAGELKVVFTLGAHTGRQDKDITVTMLDETGKPTVLHLTVNIPESPVRLSAASIVWSKGDPATEKTVDVILTDPTHTRLENLQCADTRLAVSLVPGKGPGNYTFILKPTTTDALMQAMVRLQATVNGQPRVYLVQAQVR